VAVVSGYVGVYNTIAPEIGGANPRRQHFEPLCARARSIRHALSNGANHRGIRAKGALASAAAGFTILAAIHPKAFYV
jgi:hypothetical protein